MVNKLLIALGVFSLAVVGSIGVWKLSSGDRQVGALGAIDEPIPLTWRGAWSADAKYQVGQVVSYEDSSFVAESSNAGRTPNAKDGPWALMAARGLQGAQGPAGAFSGTLQSPDGRFTLTVTNNGIEATGPSTRVKIDATRFTIDNSGAKVIVEPGAVALQGPFVRLNCSSGGTPIAKGLPAQLNGQVSVGPDGGNFPLTGAAIVQPVPTVVTC